MKDITTTGLIDRLAEGWTSSHTGLAHEFVQRWAAPLCSEAEIVEVGENAAEFKITLADIRLRTMHEVPCFLIGGNDDLSQPVHDFWNKYSSTHHLPFVLALSETARTATVDILRSGRCLILSSDQVKRILRADFPIVELKNALIKQIPRRTLIPYNFLIPAEGGMFFGRENELNRLCDEDFTSFAIAGPGRIGKTSLAFRYQSELRRRRHPRATRLIYASLYNADHLPDRIARALAMKIDNSRRSDRMTTADLLNFFLYQKKKYGGPLELILDEVDEDCDGQAFRVLGEAARSQYCRLVLCGRGVLLRMMLSSKSPLDCRLDLIQLEPLDTKSARDLLVKPITDLGFRIENCGRLADEVLSLTGSMPNLVQLFGMKLVDRAITEKKETISLEQLEVLKQDFFIAQFFIKSLNELKDSDSKLVGLAILNDGRTSFSVPEIQALAKQENLNIDTARTNEICIDLLVNNVLVWENGSYRVANAGLPFFARKKDYVKNCLLEARANRHERKK